MLLLYLFQNRWFVKEEINLHSIMLLLYQRSHQRSGTLFLIYIPLCFYFIKMCCITFLTPANLHSIMLLLYRGIKRVRRGWALSTFHYASTLSMAEVGFNKLQIHLHSIMLLLYLRGDQYRAGVWSHLHSIMLLLYLYHSVNLLTNSSSTFHYASTLSRMSIKPRLSLPHLHSIMLLLYRYTF